MVKPLELWQRLGHASYRDWVLAAQKARRVAAAAKKAAAKATTPAVQRYNSSRVYTWFLNLSDFRIYQIFLLKNQISI